MNPIERLTTPQALRLLETWRRLETDMGTLRCALDLRDPRLIERYAQGLAARATALGDLTTAYRANNSRTPLPTLINPADPECSPIR